MFCTTVYYGACFVIVCYGMLYIKAFQGGYRLVHPVQPSEVYKDARYNVSNLLRCFIAEKTNPTEGPEEKTPVSS